MRLRIWIGIEAMGQRLMGFKYRLVKSDAATCVEKNKLHVVTGTHSQAVIY